MTVTDRLVADLLDPDLYQRDPHDVWAWMRTNEPVYRDERNGLWGITRHADVMDVERRSTVFVSGLGYLLGQVKIKNISLGVAAILFVGLAFGALSPNMEIPRLMRIYFLYGAKICSPPAIDRLFKTIDFITLIDIQEMDAKSYNGFMQ